MTHPTPAQMDGMVEIISRSPDVIVRVDRDLRFLFVNDAIRAFSDVDPSDLIGRRSEDIRFFSGDADDRYHRRVREVFATGVEATHVDRVVTERGEFVLDGRLIPERGPLGEVVSVLVITRDVTALVRDLAAGAESAALSRSLLDSLPDVVAVVDRQGNIVAVNAAARRLMEVAPEVPLLGEHWSTLWPRTSHADHDEAITAAAGGRTRTLLSFAPTVAGKPRWWQTIVAPVVDDLGTGANVLVISRDITDAYLSERALEVSRARFQRLYDANVIGMFFVNLDGTLVAGNDVFLAMTGLRARDVATGRVTHRSITAPRHHARVRRAMEVLTSLGVCEPYEKDLLRVDGTMTPVLVGAAATPGDIADAIAYIVDLSPLRSAESRLMSQARQLELLLSTGTFGLWWGDLRTGEMHWTDEYRDIIGVSPDDVPSVELWRARVHPDDGPAIERTFARSLDEQSVFDVEYRLVGDDGSIRWVRSTGRTEFDEEGVPLRSSGIVIDVTDRTSAERERIAALQRERDAHGVALAAEAQFRSLFNGAAESILVADDGGRIIAANPAAEELLGYPERELTTFSVNDISPRGHLLMGFHPTAGKTSRVRSGEHDVLRRGGQSVQVESRSRAVRTADGGALHYISLRDVSERRILEQIHQESIDSISHDLKNPLAAIRAQAQLLRRRVDGNRLEEGYLAEAMASINNSVERMTTQLDDLLEVARLRAGAPLELRRMTVDLGALVTRWAADSQRTTERHIVSMDPITEPVVCSVDVNRIERVVTNLLSNAIKYSDGGVIRVSTGWETTEEGRSVAITVLDQGVGIPPDELPLVFQRFRRGSNVDGRAGGSGIGLAGVRQIVRQHGGSITVESKVGAGSAFTVRIPCPAEKTD